jgi:riboflavin biosynthesis pyrimidine reductase
MRRLLPDATDDVDVLAAYEPPPGGCVRLNMITSLDGAISVHGRSGALGGAPDHQVFAVLREWADVIVVGAGTVRSEHYGPASVDADAQRRRVARGQLAQPPIAVVSGAGDFDYSWPFFTEVAPESRPIVVTTYDNLDSVTGVAGTHADVVAAGDGRVDVQRAIEQLRARGYAQVLCEGGPGLNGDLARAGVLDELCLTLSPRIVGGDGPRIIAGDAFDPPIEPRLVHLLEEDGFEFLRLALR